MRGNRRTKERFGAWLDITLANLGILGRTLAERLGVHDSAVSRWRSGASIPDIQTLASIADALDLDRARLAVTAGYPDMVGGTEPYPMPQPTAQRESVKRQISHIKGLSDTGRGKLLDAYEELIEGDESP